MKIVCAVEKWMFASPHHPSLLKFQCSLQPSINAADNSFYTAMQYCLHFTLITLCCVIFYAVLYVVFFMSGKRNCTLLLCAGKKFQ